MARASQSQLFCTGYKRLDAAGAVQKRIFGMDMKMGKAAHGFSFGAGLRRFIRCILYLRVFKCAAYAKKSELGRLGDTACPHLCGAFPKGAQTVVHCGAGNPGSGGKLGEGIVAVLKAQPRRLSQGLAEGRKPAGAAEKKYIVGLLHRSVYGFADIGGIAVGAAVYAVAHILEHAGVFQLQQCE